MKAAGHSSQKSPGGALCVLMSLLLAPAALCADSPAAGPNSPAVGPNSQQLVDLLDRTLGWYRDVSTEREIATDAADVLVTSDDRANAQQIVRLAFEFARAASPLAEKQGTGDSSPSDASRQAQSLAQLTARLDKQIQDTQTELDGDRRRLGATSGARRQALDATVSELQGELDLANARRDAVRSMRDFVVAGSGGGTGLRAQIDALAATVPGELAASTAVAAGASGNAGAAANAAGAARPASALTPAPGAADSDSSSLWDLTARAFALSQKMSQIGALIQHTNELTDAVKGVRTPLVQALRDMSSQGDQLAQQADTAQAAQLAQERSQLDALAAQFKAISGAVLPLAKEGVLLADYQRSLMGWRDAMRTRYHDALRGLGVRLLILALVLAFVVVAAELWKRAVYRYVHEVRRRYQFLLLRRFVLWFVIGIIIVIAFASRLDSFVTVAGLVTAGVAVALQNVILAVVGYFFLIGKYGIRAGDHVQIGDVSGEVIDVGLVRLHLMELGRDSGPTGRVVAFSNSVVFQASGGLFKQIPGVHFAWHELTLTLPAVTDYAALKDRLRQAAETALTQYRAEIERQSRELERTVPGNGHAFAVTVRLRFLTEGIEATVRYPVDLRHAAEIDEVVAAQLHQVH